MGQGGQSFVELSICNLIPDYGGTGEDTDAPLPRFPCSRLGMHWQWIWSSPGTKTCDIYLTMTKVLLARMLTSKWTTLFDEELASSDRALAVLSHGSYINSVPSSPSGIVPNTI